MRPSYFAIASGLISFLHALSVYGAGGDPEAGRRQTVTCNACHGQASLQSVPNLGGQSFAYFVSAMRAYQEDGKRSHGTMRDVAKAYKDKELKNFAAHYAQFASMAEGSGAAKPVQASVCEGCHGQEGRSPTNPESAVIVGQKGSYLKMTIGEYRDGTRKHAPESVTSTRMAPSTRPFRRPTISGR